MKIIIIGAVAAGISTVAKARLNDENAEGLYEKSHVYGAIFSIHHAFRISSISF